jgi:hypothetical protein
MVGAAVQPVAVFGCNPRDSSEGPLLASKQGTFGVAKDKSLGIINEKCSLEGPKDTRSFE